ncbi:hypothetical protein FB567DRAFT_6647 [Paraphoma chrysanthemicola]|uniref:BTB domain-containing protein n=1 Tax=Paraphoma chrysanthemicola TaxID=798071 RepID=A0A8K0RFW3_9PLEO|nr:hypothetical protein FB567DRAFT_6647 [Paraphoma chrysanthemicola]
MATKKKKTGKTLGPAKLPLSTITKEPMVLVEVGPKHEKHYIHKALLVHHSDYFRKALQGPWKEAHSGKVVLEDVESAIFNIFEHWLYFGSLPSSTDTESAVSEWREITQQLLHHDAESVILWCIQAYALGERFQAPKLCDALIDVCVTLDVDFVDFDCDNILPTIEFAFANIPKDHPILHFLVNRFCEAWEENEDCEWDLEAQDKFPNEFKKRVTRRLSEMLRAAKNNKKEPKRCYHQHASDVEKKACSRAHMVYNELRDYGYFE